MTQLWGEQAIGFINEGAIGFMFVVYLGRIMDLCINPTNEKIQGLQDK